MQFDKVMISEIHIGYVAGCVCRDVLYIEMVKQRTILCCWDNFKMMNFT